MPLRVIEGKFKKGVVTLKKVPKDIEESEIVVIFTHEKKIERKKMQNDLKEALLNVKDMQAGKLPKKSARNLLDEL
ncbi:MAG: hypothetical protein CV087_01675 [Candidatus Brocadia sp. WS118]|nr:MAG: hypothetical protein CV087_01675 [Candidatus Brocadia sp. WS118]